MATNNARSNYPNSPIIRKTVTLIPLNDDDEIPTYGFFSPAADEFFTGIARAVAGLAVCYFAAHIAVWAIRGFEIAGR